MASTILGVLGCVWHYPQLYSSPYLHLEAEGLRWVGLFSVQILVAQLLFVDRGRPRHPA